MCSFTIKSGTNFQSIVCLTKSLVQDSLSLTVLTKPIEVIFLTKEKKSGKCLHCTSYSNFSAKNFKNGSFYYDMFENLTFR